MRYLRSSGLLFAVGTLLLIALISWLFYVYNRTTHTSLKPHAPQSAHWQAPDISKLPAGPLADEIRYGRELIAHTARYLGPQGSVAHLANYLNCQNCHLEAGTKLFANPFTSVASTYPKYRTRSGMVESVAFRVNDCMQRSLNGNKLDSNGKEMQAMVAYINWVGKDVLKNEKINGTGVTELLFLNRAADPVKGRMVYVQKCSRCHGVAGNGIPAQDGKEYVYPPLWGNYSFNTAAGMYRLSALAGFIKSNMPFDSVQLGYHLTTDAAWDVAAYVVTQKRPHKIFTTDWPDMAKKPVDFPFGPYSDSFPQSQHQFGPFEPIKKAQTKN